ncbi:flagellin [Rhizobiaceae bacterium n13]|uniref:Flagellin n=1 Tax=Ferirhizobium litorale TaxID=2927786 RepID=A0AAE3U0Q7_9HYPH|nr:flagellin [Fererhizobium litorale]MDI7863409.1 flagellin [Fererhizobium litorale]MDI7922314.1 flagellin [Fererhizobium litorale]
MTSILTNNAAMSALQTLRSINDSMEETQSRVSSGLRVGTASDNAAYWSIATTMRSDNMALSAVEDALGLGAAKVDTAYAAMESAIEVVKEIKAKVVAATEQGVDKAKIHEEILQLQKQLKSIAEAASFSGENWIAGDAEMKSVVSGFVRSSDGTVAVTTTEYELTDTADGTLLFGGDGAGGIDDTTGIVGTTATFTNAGPFSIYTLDITTFTGVDVPANMAEALKLVEDGLQAMTSAAAALGSISMRVGLQEDFVSKLTDSIDSGIGRLVDADMNEESTRLKALQTQQQLGIQSLSIANTSSENILQLFRQ